MIKSNLISTTKLSNGSSTVDLRTLSDNYNNENMKKVPQVICCEKISNGQDTFSLSDLGKGKPQSKCVECGIKQSTIDTLSSRYEQLQEEHSKCTVDNYFKKIKLYIENGTINSESEITFTLEKFTSVDDLQLEEGKPYTGLYFFYNQDTFQYMLCLYWKEAVEYSENNSGDRWSDIQFIANNSITLGKDEYFLGGFIQGLLVTENDNDPEFSNLTIIDSKDKVIWQYNSTYPTSNELFYTDSQNL